ncbi:T9SS type A sorting domain-containing protein [Adhaeribacter sp. BT258]|uniref:T9SS type A sorting domain-containing protein n=1 Tax=Adhaeribacter terrigena TaxID=2793070 RepID=A0ABS1BX81_9BACT|nr:T9SS type A sorting domain-containing protein [Adhaeribacter terrigena]MBK0401749.1 T9SS type A sorting domain-containing protein [Adhaeribacter terrigena]
MKKALTFLLFGITFNAFSQGTQTHGQAKLNLDVSNINPTILTGGDMFNSFGSMGTVNGLPAFEVPRGSGKHTIFAGALWIGGKDQQNNLYLSAQTYRQGAPHDAGYWPGPIGAVQGTAHSAKYDKLWKVSKAEIQTHIADFNKPGYTMPADIANWPGNGDAANGEAAKLAPFIDINNDGIYSPAQGDYPNINGDQAIYLILNDNGNVKIPSSPSMNAEVHVMHYGYDNPANAAVFNTLFTEYRVINRGTINLEDFYAGVWVDFDLGYYIDDFIGCDTLQNRFFVYNGDNYDEDTIFTHQTGTGPITIDPNGYGANPPAQSVIFLDKKMSHFVYYNNNSNPVNGNPGWASDYYNYMRGYWKNGQRLTYGGDGTDTLNAPANYMFPGNPVTGAGWSEVNNLPPAGSNVPGDRRGVGSIGPFNLNAGQDLKFTVAYNYSRGTSNLNSLVTAAQDAQTVQNFFRSSIVSATKPEILSQSLMLFPNPASDLLQIQLPNSLRNKEATIAITDNTGRIVLETKAIKASQNQQLNISGLSKGIYQVTVISEEQTISSKLVKL